MNKDLMDTVESLGGTVLMGGILIQFTDATFMDALKKIYESGAEAEREACARVCELMWHRWLDSPEENEPNKPDAEDCYRAIRERGQA